MSNIRARFELSTEIAAVCDVKSTRYSLGAVQVVPGPDATVYVSATDTRILAINRVEGSADGEQLIPATPIGKATQSAPKRVEANGRVEVTSGRGAKAKTVVADGNVQGRFPRVADVFPEMSSSAEWRVLTVDARLLAKLAAAVSTDGKVSLLIAPPEASFDLHNDNSAIDSAVPVLGDCGFGLLMPCAADGPIVRNGAAGQTIEQTQAEMKFDQFKERAESFQIAARAALAKKLAAEQTA